MAKGETKLQKIQSKLPQKTDGQAEGGEIIKLKGRKTHNKSELEKGARMYEYTSAANPEMTVVPHVAMGPKDYSNNGKSGVTTLDLSKALGVKYQATSPNLLASFVRVNKGDEVETKLTATSKSFFVIKGSGSSSGSFGAIEWNKGDLFVVPDCKEGITHKASDDAVLYLVSDQPLMKYLGVTQLEPKIKPT